MQHFSASLPHLAMALADMHLVLGGEDPTFVKSQVCASRSLLSSSLSHNFSHMGRRKLRGEVA